MNDLLMARLRVDRCAVAAVSAALCVWLAGVSFGAPPDLTVPGTVVDTTLTYNLGPTGARGWIYYQKPDAAPVGPRL